MNKIILNGHKILSKENLIDNLNYQSKAKKLGFELKNLESLANFLPKETIFAIWHCDSFLKDEDEKTLWEIVRFFSQNFDLKLTWKYKKVLEKYL